MTDMRLLCLKADMLLGISKVFSRVFWHFLNHGGKISCEVTGRRKLGNGLEVPFVCL